ncbi:glycerol-3-phosphate 1-O-acyltransferase PlsY [Campylobacter canadensis]|uniref:Glycerol-3-phosphate acyltransferase n=1 Tax=Campylobacter canadensis TaxID=449520 RepID=A0ABS7WQW0_9BACT|nr:glycerol-3-phosphate 1-O-acyltransferase PlsY [Campylobacter canadensis]MBZ7986908.1 glycerol-3-phosphate 1-O-acyltransferase PlsY [Campylobacter canadensis]MBZ7997945.1 glycerol-3-phosphate 1-O-acyltransferase PlsY [Campylobacter canadensis]
MPFLTFIIDIFTKSNLLCLLAAYLIGSIPFGLIYAKIFARVDITKEGSKSIGATNVLRVVKQNNPKLAKKLAIATMLSDLLKGTLCILVAKLLAVPANIYWAMAIMLVFGHCYSAFLKFNGGKGVACGAGSLLLLIPYSVLIGLFCWLIIGKVFKISSLASLIGFSIGVFSAEFLYAQTEIGSHAPLYIILFIVFYQHIPNIIRLIKKDECKVI